MRKCLGFGATLVYVVEEIVKMVFLPDVLDMTAAETDSEDMLVHVEVHTHDCIWNGTHTGREHVLVMGEVDADAVDVSMSCNLYLSEETASLLSGHMPARLNPAVTLLGFIASCHG